MERPLQHLQEGEGLNMHLAITQASEDVSRVFGMPRETTPTWTNWLAVIPLDASTNLCASETPYQTAYQRPEVLGVIGMDQMAQLMDHHIVSVGMRRLDDVPVEEQLTSGIARPPTGLEVVDADP